MTYQGIITGNLQLAFSSVLYCLNASYMTFDVDPATFSPCDVSISPAQKSKKKTTPTSFDTQPTNSYQHLPLQHITSVNDEREFNTCEAR